MTIAVLPVYRYKKTGTDVVVSTVSSSRGWNQGLSPFILGPCHLYDDYTAVRMENAWQFSKVYKKHTDRWGDPTPDYFRWAEQGWADEKAHRYPMGRGAKPEYSFWAGGSKLGYIQARKHIYAPLYARAVVKTEAWQELKDRYKKCVASGRRLVLLDYDAYDHASLGMTLTDVLNESNAKMGHAFVLAMLLLKDKAITKTAYRGPL